MEYRRQPLQTGQGASVARALRGWLLASAALLELLEGGGQNGPSLCSGVGNGNSPSRKEGTGGLQEGDRALDSADFEFFYKINLT